MNQEPVPAFTLLEAILVRLPADRCTADTGKWTRAVALLRDRYASSQPELFANLHFRSRRPLIHSQQVSEFLTLHRHGGMAIRATSQGPALFQLDPASRARLCANHADLLRTHGPIITRMARELHSSITRTT